MVIGIDGATWDALGPYIREGVMPGLGRILAESASGPLRSVIPPITAPAWVSFATGVNPGRHGCFNFMTMRSFGDLRPINASDIKVETFYETLVRNGYQCTLINLPVSYPPRIDRTLITGLLSMGDDYVHPPELAGEIAPLQEYQIVPNGIKPWVHSEFPHDSDLITNNEEVRFKVAQQLFSREWDFFFVLFSGSDGIQHRAFTEMLSGEGPKAEGAREYFARLDGWVSWFYENVEPGALKIIMSDHGFRVGKGTLAVNAWLDRAGYLKFVPGRDTSKVRSAAMEKAFEERPMELKSSTRRLRDFATSNPLTSRAVPLLKKAAGRSERLRDLVSNEYRPDYDHSEAICFFPGIYVRKDTDRYQEIVNDLLEGLGELNSKYHVFSQACRREDIYWGPYVSLSPEIMMLDPDFRLFSSVRKKLFIEAPTPWHDKDGIWMMSGPPGVDGREAKASILDICPTIIEWMGVEPAHDYDGKSLLGRLA